MTAPDEPAELEALRSLATELCTTRALIDRDLEPFWTGWNNVTNSIKQTHACISGSDAVEKGADRETVELFETYVTAYVRDVAARRREMFARRDALSAKYGKLRERRRELNRRLSALDRDIRALERLLSKVRAAIPAALPPLPLFEGAAQ